MSNEIEEIIGFDAMGKALTLSGRRLTLKWDPMTRQIAGVPVKDPGIDQIGEREQQDKKDRWRAVDQLGGQRGR